MLCDKIIFNLKCLLIEFIVPNLSLINFCILEIFKTNPKIGFRVQNHLWNSCSSARLLFSQKAGVKCVY